MNGRRCGIPPSGRRQRKMSQRRKKKNSKVLPTSTIGFICKCHTVRMEKGSLYSLLFLSQALYTNIDMLDFQAQQVTGRLGSWCMLSLLSPPVKSSTSLGLSTPHHSVVWAWPRPCPIISKVRATCSQDAFTSQSQRMQHIDNPKSKNRKFLGEAHLSVLLTFVFFFCRDQFRNAHTDTTGGDSCAPGELPSHCKMGKISSGKMDRAYQLSIIIKHCGTANRPRICACHTEGQGCTRERADRIWEDSGISGGDSQRPASTGAEGQQSGGNARPHHCAHARAVPPDL